MSDPVGLISTVGSLQRSAAVGPRPDQGVPEGAGQPGFKEFLKQQIERVNELQNDANVAIEDLAAGRRDDLESVIVATQKADIAFRMLLQVRNKVMDAYEEVKQLRI